MTTGALNVLISQDSWSQSIDAMRTNYEPSGRLWADHPPKATAAQSPLSAAERRSPSRQPKHVAAASKSAAAGSSSYTKRDILCGRGGLANKHFGNKVFRRLIKHNKELYRKLKSKRKQELLIKSILLAVHSQGGRFLKVDKHTHAWHEISEKDASNKTSQALREPDKRAGDDQEDIEGEEDTSDDGQFSERSGSTRSGGGAATTTAFSSAAAASAPIPYPPPPPQLVRHYTAESQNPPRADPRVFDRHDGLLGGGGESMDDDDDEALVAPALLEMSTAAFSKAFLQNLSVGRPSEISVPMVPPAQQRHHCQHSLLPSFPGDCALPPPPLSRESTSLVLGLRSIDWESLDSLCAPKPSALLRSDTIGTFAEPNDDPAATLFSAPPPASLAATTSHCPPPPPLLRFTSSAFLRGLDDSVVAASGVLQRQESTASSIDYAAV